MRTFTVALDDLQPGFRRHLANCARDVVTNIAAACDDDTGRLLFFVPEETERAAA